MEVREYLIKVSRKGQVVIPAEVRRMLGIRDRVLLRVEGGSIRIIPVIPLEELFGVDGEAMREVAREISRERLEELRREA